MASFIPLSDQINKQHQTSHFITSFKLNNKSITLFLFLKRSIFLIIDNSGTGPMAHSVVAEGKSERKPIDSGSGLTGARMYSGSSNKNHNCVWAVPVSGSGS